jgi:hypothetical protein
VRVMSKVSLPLAKRSVEMICKLTSLRDRQHEQLAIAAQRFDSWCTRSNRMNRQKHFQVDENLFAIENQTE